MPGEEHSILAVRTPSWASSLSMKVCIPIALLC